MDDNTQKPQPPANLPMTPPPIPSRPSFTPPAPPSIPVRPPAPSAISLPPRPTAPPFSAPAPAPVSSRPAEMSLPPKPFVPPSPAEAGFGGQSPLAREGGLRPSVPSAPLPPRPMTPPAFGEARPPDGRPPVRPPEISLRTMKSDLESKPPFASPEEILKPMAPKPGLAKIAVKPSKLKPILIITGALIFGIALALAGYFYIFPYFFPAEEAPAPVTTTPPAGQFPTTPDIGGPSAPSAGFLTHLSLLKTTADVQAPVTVDILDANFLKQVLISEAGNQPAGTNVLKEVLLSGTSGQLNFSDAFPLLVPEFSKFELANLFEEDFTSLLFYDANGVWPAWVAKLKAGANLSGAKTLFARIESANLTGLYLASPGTTAGSFKSGNVSGVSTRYQTFSSKGASLNYAWVGDKLVISTSFNGLKRILSSL